MNATTSLFAWTNSATLAVLPLGTFGAIGDWHLSCAKAGPLNIAKAAASRQNLRIITVLLRSNGHCEDIEHNRRAAQSPFDGPPLHPTGPPVKSGAGSRSRG